MFFKQTFTIGAKWNFIKLQNVRKLEEQDTANTVAFSWINFELNQTCSFKQRSTHKNASYEGLVLIFLIFSQLIVSFLQVVTCLVSFLHVRTRFPQVAEGAWGLPPNHDIFWNLPPPRQISPMRRSPPPQLKSEAPSFPQENDAPLLPS